MTDESLAAPTYAIVNRWDLVRYYTKKAKYLPLCVFIIDGFKHPGNLYLNKIRSHNRRRAEESPVREQDESSPHNELSQPAQFVFRNILCNYHFQQFQRCLKDLRK